jgi:hypothetical protein
MKNNILIMAAFLVIIMASCQTEDIDPGAAANNELSGEWFVEYNHEVFGHDPWGVGYTRLLTSTTASESANELIITDEENFREFRVKARMDISSKTFGSPDSLVDYIHGVKVVITNGRIIENAVTTTAGVVTDSIYFDLYLRDLDETLNVSGYRRTGFLEDEH